MDRTLLQSNPLQTTIVESSRAYEMTLLGVGAARPYTQTRGHGTGRITVLPRAGAQDDPMLVKNARPRFTVDRPLGEGGAGQVVAALDQDIGRHVAIKTLRPEMQAPAHVARFVDEIRTVGALEHPNIVPIHDVGENEDGSLYFVMRCVEGETLESIVDRLAAGDRAAHAEWTFERRTHVFRQLLDAVAFAHDRGYVHRDIKPANVMVGKHGEVFLMDWGIAKPMGATEQAEARGADSERATATHAGSIVGTPLYMSPEQARGEGVDARSDVYSLSVLFHELLSLKHYLSERRTVEHVLQGVIDTPAPLASLVTSPHQTTVPTDLTWFVHKGLAKAPSARFQSVREMIARLDAREEGLIPVECPVTFVKRGTREMLRAVDRHPMITTAMVGMMAMSWMAAVVWWIAKMVV